MSRLFNNSLSNYMGLGIGTVGAVLHNKSVVSVSALVRPTAASTAGANDNGIITVISNGSSVAFALNVDASGGTNKVRLNGRSLNTETRQGRSTTSTFALDTPIHAGGTMDFAGDAIYPVLNGVISNGGAATFANSVYTQGTPTNADAIGGFIAPPTTVSAQFQGLIAELAIWTGALTLREWNALSKGYSPLKIQRASLLFYWPIMGQSNPEPELIRNAVATVTGTITKARHPRVIL